MSGFKLIDSDTEENYEFFERGVEAEIDDSIFDDQVMVDEFLEELIVP
jgi:hypothetical protein